MSDQGLKELYIDELKDLYNAETQLVKALPKMAKAASSTSYGRDLKNISNRPKGSNEEWVNPYDPEAEITRLKNGRTALATRPNTPWTLTLERLWQ